MWREIRGKGLAYSYSMTLQPSEGSLILKLARAAQLTRAYEEALNILVSEKKMYIVIVIIFFIFFVAFNGTCFDSFDFVST